MNFSALSSEGDVRDVCFDWAQQTYSQTVRSMAVTSVRKVALVAADVHRPKVSL